MKPGQKGKSPLKRETAHMNVSCSQEFKAAIHRIAKDEGRDVSVIIRRLLREKYPDLPEE